MRAELLAGEAFFSSFGCAALLVDHRGQPLRHESQKSGRVRARYDAASSDIDNANHWAMADSLSAVRANSEHVRRRLRERSRYEVSNNSYARGAINTIASYTVGSGPTLQLTFRGDERSSDQNRVLRQAAQRVEWLWSSWAYAKRLTQKLWTASVALDQDGESFGLLTDGSDSTHSPVTLDVRLYECDQFACPDGGNWELDDSGIRLGADGEPAEYSILEQHPGDCGMFAGSQSRWLPASQVIHLYRKERPGQLRGIPRTTPALPLFAQLRRFVLATITAAETAADFAAILNQDVAGDDSEAASPWERIQLERGAMLSVPDGSRISQLKAEHPNATFDEFVKAILREIARCISIPAVLMLGDASGYNYASGRLDLQSFQRALAVDRSQILEREFLDKLWEAWLAEALLIPGFLPVEFAANWNDFEFGWRWSEPEHVDRVKEANGQKQELANNTTTLSREYARRGLDWETELRQRARELELQRELGLVASETHTDLPGDMDGDED